MPPAQCVSIVRVCVFYVQTVRVVLAWYMQSIHTMCATSGHLSDQSMSCVCLLAPHTIDSLNRNLVNGIAFTLHVRVCWVPLQ